MGRSLVARFHSLGDVVLATGIVEALAGRGQEIEVVTLERFIPLFEGGSAGAIWSPERISQVRRPFDRVIDLQANATSRAILRGMGPIRRSRGRAWQRRWVVFWGRRPPRPYVPHAVARYAEASGIAKPDPRNLRPALRPTPRDLEEARALPRSWEATVARCVAFCEGASRPMKRWPHERFESLAEELSRSGYRVLRFLEPRGIPEEGAGWVRAPLRSLKGLLSRCAALVTNDSGIMHMGVGFGVPVVAIFASTSLEFGFGPLGPRDRVVEHDLACRPCGVHGARFCWQGHEACRRGVSVEEVRTALEGVLA